MMFSKRLYVTGLALLPSLPVYAEIEEIIVTATQRSVKLQDLPYSATAIPADVIARHRITDLGNIAEVTPGMSFVDLGARDIGNNIIMRGINTGAVGPGMSGTYKTSVATYLGNTPVYVDLKPLDLARVEVLQGPQGTLYGASTLAGAVRYIPNKAAFENSAEIWTELSQYSEADSPSYVVGTTANYAIADNLAVRLSVQQLSDSGYIDYSMVVREPGVSNAQPDFSDPTAVATNLRTVDDNNGEDTVTARMAVRFEPTAWLGFDLNYWYQDQHAEGRGLSHVDALNGLIQLDEFESAMRIEEPSDITNEVLSLDASFDLGFATLTSASAITQFNENGFRDQTDLFLGFGFGYEEFEGFTAIANDRSEDTSHVQEFRLVSKDSASLTWLVGYYYNDYRSKTRSVETTPLYDEWLTGENLRSDDIDFIGVGDESLTEKAFYGEATLMLGKLALTLGGRLYDYDNEQSLAFDLPLTETVFFGRSDGSVVLDPVVVKNNDDGALFKFNADYRFTPSTLAYATLSEGYRIGGLNGISPCTGDETPDELVFCALPNEVAYEADTTLNKELGLRSQLFNERLSFNAAIYHIDWDNVQVPTTTENGGLNIIVGGGKAVSQGVELSFSAQLTEKLLISGQYTYNDAFLDTTAPGLVRGDDGQKGDTLPGSPDHSASLAASYDMSLFGRKAVVNYSLAYTGDVYTTVGARGNRNQGEVLDAYSVQDISLTLGENRWQARLFVNNIFDKNVVTAVRNDRASLVDAGGVNFRNYGRYMGQPRNIGLGVTYTF